MGNRGIESEYPLTKINLCNNEIGAEGGKAMRGIESEYLVD